MPFKFRHPSFGGASPGNYTLFSSLLFSSLLFSSKLYFKIKKEIKKIFEKTPKEKIRVIKRRKKFYYIIIFIIISIINKYNSQEMDDLSYSYITMKMHEGYHMVMSNGYGGFGYKCTMDFTKPNEIYINGKNQSIIRSNYQFDKKEGNYAKLIWKTPVINCESMFCNCDHILEMNLTHFNTAQVT